MSEEFQGYKITGATLNNLPHIVISNHGKEIVRIKNDGTVVVSEYGADKEAARLFYESLEINGKTLHQRIAELDVERNEWRAYCNKRGVDIDRLESEVEDLRQQRGQIVELTHQRIKELESEVARYREALTKIAPALLLAHGSISYDEYLDKGGKQCRAIDFLEDDGTCSVCKVAREVLQEVKE